MDMELNEKTLKKLMRKAAPDWKDMDNPPTDNSVESFRQYAALVILKQFKEALAQIENKTGATTAKVALGFELEIGSDAAETKSTEVESSNSVTLRCTRWGWPEDFTSTWDV